MTEAEKEQELLAQKAKNFAMTEEDDLIDEQDEHVHVHGCCSCHSNVGK
jgi:hypothetical protein